ncbi:MAG: hypothetical protein K9H49_10725 [Bacteroidales bacterium]|nr:hypothetical protein [Bacteroidales bacterium]MCF8391639.1 hypothetical protein [Bacteroidales bacterium]
MKLKTKIIVISLFAIAMGFLETTVVIYLRELLYPTGFAFPLVPIPSDLAFIEILREAATLIMLLAIAIISGKTFSERFAWFIYTFAIWDIFYYIFLKLLIFWPESLMTWDILFLIPTTWTGPVISPIIVSLSMIFLAIIIVIYADKGKNTKLSKLEWIGLIAGSLVLILAFIIDYSEYMLSHFSLFEMLNMADEEVMKIAFEYIPKRFPWGIFIFGEVVILGTIGVLWRRLGEMD